MALDIERVVDGGVRGKKFLGDPLGLEFLHLALPPAGGRCEFSARLFFRRPRMPGSIPSLGRGAVEPKSS